MIGFYAHQSHLRAKGKPETPADLAQMRLIGYDRNPIPAEVIAQAEFFQSREKLSLRTDSDLAQLAAIRAGAINAAFFNDDKNAKRTSE